MTCPRPVRIPWRPRRWRGSSLTAGSAPPREQGITERGQQAIRKRLKGLMKLNIQRVRFCRDQQLIVNAKPMHPIPWVED